MNKKYWAKQNESQFSAIILAAGYSSRMEGKIKALLPLGLSNTMLSMAVKSFQAANIFDIHVVVGHEHAQIENAAKDLGINIVYNENFQSGMFSSICAGLMAVIASNILPKKAAFVLPVDAPLVKSNTIENLAALWSELSDTKNILIPIFMENCGHPPLIGNTHFDAVINYQAQGGLRGYFASLLRKDQSADFLQGLIPRENYSDYIKFIPIIDEGIKSDIDTMAEYEKAQNFLKITQNREQASISESWYLLQKADLPERIVRHSYMVALGALRLGIALKANMANKINLEYHICGGLLHDIYRQHKDHAFKCSEFLNTLGWKDLAYIVGSHTVLPKNILENMEIYLPEDSVESEITNNYSVQDDILKINPQCFYACLCVYLADKFFSADIFVTMEERFSRVKDRFANDALALKAIEQREAVALAVCDWFYKEAKIKADDCVQKESGHVLESKLKELLKV